MNNKICFNNPPHLLRSSEPAIHYHLDTKAEKTITTEYTVALSKQIIIEICDGIPKASREVMAGRCPECGQLYIRQPE